MSWRSPWRLRRCLTVFPLEACNGAAPARAANAASERSRPLCGGSSYWSEPVDLEQAGSELLDVLGQRGTVVLELTGQLKDRRCEASRFGSDRSSGASPGRVDKSDERHRH